MEGFPYSFRITSPPILEEPVTTGLLGGGEDKERDEKKIEFPFCV
jgi:hypothetical protein